MEENSTNGRGIHPISQPIDGQNLAKDLTGFDIYFGDDKHKGSLRKLFLTLTEFINDNEAADFVACMHKCIRFKMWDELDLFTMRLMSKVGIKGRGRDDLVKAIAGIYMMKDDNERDRDGRKSSQKPQRSNV